MQRNFGLTKAKKEARKTAIEQINKGGGSLIEKGKKITEAFKEIHKYTDY